MNCERVERSAPPEEFRHEGNRLPPGSAGSALGLVSQSRKGDSQVRVLMTGGYGCIGSWIAKQLCEAGEEVWIFDLKEDTHRLDLVLDRDQQAAVHFVPGDVSDADALRSAVGAVGASHILHLAGLQTPTCRANPILGAKVNVIGTLAAFEAAVAQKHQVQRVVYASSAAVHGPAEPDAPASIGDSVRLAPLSHYGASRCATS